MELDMKSILYSLLLTALLPCTVAAQTYFYIDEIVVDPQPAATEDVVSIDLIGNLSSSGSYIVSATANVTGSLVAITVVAASTGGLTVLVPHTETIVLGQLPAGTYQVAVSLGSQGVLFPPDPVSFVVDGAGSSCDSLVVSSITWHAFSDTAIVVHVFNNSTTLFDYPNFILFDANGDTLAKETVNFFGIAGESWHLLRIHDDATIPNAPFNGALELWTLFTEELACTWDLAIDLCPPPPCATLIPTIQNLGGALAIGTYSWSISDEDFLVVASGQFEMTDTIQYDSDTLCLPPGSYYMAVSMNQPPTGGNPVYSVTNEGYISGPSQSVPWDLPVLMPFNFYLPCDDGTNTVVEQVSSPIATQLQGDLLTIRRSDGSAIGALELFDAQGRFIVRKSSLSSEIVLTLSGTASAFYVLRTTDLRMKIPVVR